MGACIGQGRLAPHRARCFLPLQVLSLEKKEMQIMGAV